MMRWLRPTALSISVMFGINATAAAEELTKFYSHKTFELPDQEIQRGDYIVAVYMSNITFSIIEKRTNYGYKRARVFVLDFDHRNAWHAGDDTFANAMMWYVVDNEGKEWPVTITYYMQIMGSCHKEGGRHTQSARIKPDVPIEKIVGVKLLLQKIDGDVGQC